MKLLLDTCFSVILMIMLVGGTIFTGLAPNSRDIELSLSWAYMIFCEYTIEIAKSIYYR